MPVNLNAFIRYKTIDSCLRNDFLKSDIKLLIRKCSEAVSEKMGEEIRISERTIREDIRVLRSNILGFDAPIICAEGIYSYSDPSYSILNTSISERELLIDIQDLLLEEYSNIKNAKVKNLIINLSEITGKEISSKYGDEFHRIYEKKLLDGKPLSEADRFKNGLSNYIWELERDRIKLKKRVLPRLFGNKRKKPKELFNWNWIFEGLKICSKA